MSVLAFCDAEFAGGKPRDYYGTRPCISRVVVARVAARRKTELDEAMERMKAMREATERLKTLLKAIRKGRL